MQHSAFDIDHMPASGTSRRRGAAFVAIPSDRADRAAGAATRAGTAVRCRGAATAARNGVAEPLGVGLPVFAADRISTAPDGLLGLRLADDTLVRIRGAAALVIDHFVFRPDWPVGDVTLDLESGGVILRPGAVAAMPRGTMELYAGPARIRPRRGAVWVENGPKRVRVVLLDAGRCAVETAGGTVLLESAGDETAVDDAILPPRRIRAVRRPELEALRAEAAL